LGALWTEVLQQSKIINARQSEALKRHIQIQMQHDREHAKLVRNLKAFARWFGMLIAILVFTMIIMWFVVQDRIEKYPQLGTEWFPKTDKQRRQEAMPKQYIGR
jgi:hypothetical protein